jgi:hypothetical protein
MAAGLCYANLCAAFVQLLQASKHKKAQKDSAAAAAGGGVSVEAVAKQLGALTADERAAALLADAPELAALLEELTAALTEVS